jgi:uncharacterized lipoprotein YddW (UPF0748 family)
MSKLLLSLLMLGCVVVSSAGAAGRESRVAVLADPGGPNEAETARECLERTQRILRSAGMDHSVVTQGEALAGGLRGYGVLIVPFAPNLSDAGRAAVKSFCSDGGKVMCFYSTYGLEKQLGLAGVRYVPSPDRTLFRRVSFRQGVLDGLPAAFDQTSWNINSPTPAPATLIVADWLGAEGADSHHAAATISDGGFFFSHILIPETPDDEAAAGRMLRAAAEYLSQRVTPPPEVAIIYGTLSERAGQSDSDIVARMVAEMEQILGAAGVDYAVLTDEAVARGALAGRRVAVFPLNFTVSEAEAAQVRRFVAEGGRIIAMYSVSERLRPLVGVASTQFRSGGSQSPFQVARFGPAAPARFPEALAQPAWNTMEATPSADGVVVATWHDGAGRGTGTPAVILSPTGMYYSYILWAGEVKATSDFVLAAMAHLAGDDFYGQAARREAAGLWGLRRYEDRSALEAACDGLAGAEQAFQRAAGLEDEAERLLAAGSRYDAYRTFRRARTFAERAFIRGLPARGGVEFRGAWLHAPTAPNDDWDALFAGMKESNLNALLPNVCTGGYAHYESDVLPLSRLIRERGPQMDAMLAAARRHGIEVHLWRVNYNLFRPDEEVFEGHEAAGRLCLDPRGNVVGGPGTGTLCPSHPANQQLEIDAMVEMARRFPVAGIHFDYIRYPGANACFCPGCRRRFEARLGRRVGDWPADVLRDGALYEEYQDFRRDQITHVVREVSERVRAEKPELQISAAVFSHWDLWSRDSVAQDWVLWVREGLLDFVCPMNYTQDVGDLGQTVAKQRDWVGGRIPLCSGIGAWRSPSAWHTADLVDTARRNGADGIVFFEYRGQVVRDFIPALREGPFAEEASTPWAD